MRLPRDISGKDLGQRLAGLGYRVTRTTGSHQRLTTTKGGVHHITVPLHESLRVGTLAGILQEVAKHFEIDRADLEDQLFNR